MKRSCFTPLHRNPRCVSKRAGFWTLGISVTSSFNGNPGSLGGTVGWRWNRNLGRTHSISWGRGRFGSWNAPLKNTKVFFINPRWLVGDGISEPNQQYMFFFFFSGCSFLMSHGRMNWKCTCTGWFLYSKGIGKSHGSILWVWDRISNILECLWGLWNLTTKIPHDETKIATSRYSFSM